MAKAKDTFAVALVFALLGQAGTTAAIAQSRQDLQKMERPGGMPRMDHGKALIEFPVKRLITGNAQVYPALRSNATGRPMFVPAATDPSRVLADAMRQTEHNLAARGHVKTYFKPIYVSQARTAPETRPNSTRDAKDTRSSTIATSQDNPQCQPGLVKWHNSFESACQAAASSGKPVLFFQMLGNLDQEFC